MTALFMSGVCYIFIDLGVILIGSNLAGMCMFIKDCITN